MRIGPRIITSAYNLDTFSTSQYCLLHPAFCQAVEHGCQCQWHIMHGDAMPRLPLLVMQVAAFYAAMGSMLGTKLENMDKYGAKESKLQAGMHSPSGASQAVVKRDQLGQG